MMEKRYQVFVSSTFVDLQNERDKVIQTLMKMNCIPAGMEMFNAVDDEQFNFIKRVIDDSDYYIVIIGGRYGSLSADGLSYTEKEFDYAIKKGLKVIALIHSEPDNIPVGKAEADPKLRKKLEAFKVKIQTGRLVEYWKTADELPGKVALSLQSTINIYPAVGWVRGNAVSTDLYKEVAELQKENAQLRDLVHDAIPPAENDILIGKFSYQKIRTALIKKMIPFNGRNENALELFKRYHASFIEGIYKNSKDENLFILVQSLCPVLLVLGLVDSKVSTYQINPNGNAFLAQDFLQEE